MTFDEINKKHSITAAVEPNQTSSVNVATSSKPSFSDITKKHGIGEQTPISGSPVVSKDVIKEFSPIPSGALTPSNMQKHINQTWEQNKAVLNEKRSDPDYVEESRLKQEMEDAEQRWESWKNSDYSTLSKALDYIGNKEINDLHQEYEDKKRAYDDFKEKLVEKRQLEAEENIQKQFGVTGSEYIEQLKAKKKQAQSKEEKELYNNEIKTLRKNLYGDTSVFKYIGDAAKRGAVQSGKLIASTFDFLLGNPAKWLGFENNIFSQINQDWSNRLEKSNAETIKSAKALGDDNAIGGEAVTALVGALPDVLLTILTSGTSQATTLGTRAISAFNPTLLNKIQTEIIKTAKSPIYWSSFIRQVGTNYEENLENGNANELTASLAALLSSTITSKMEMGGFQSFGDELAETKGLGKKIYKWISSSFEEGFEEPGQTTVTNLINKILFDKDKELVSTTDENAVLNPKRALKEFGIGTFVGSVLGGSQLTFNGIINAKNNSQYKAIGKAAIKNSNIQEIIDYAKSSPNDTVRLIARQTNANNISDADAGKLYQYAVSNVNEMFEDVYTVEDLNKVVSEYFLNNTPKAIKDIASASFANKLAEMNIDPNTSEVYKGLTTTPTETEQQSVAGSETETQPVMPNQPITEQSQVENDGAVGSSEIGGYGLTNPTDQEIYREPTTEEYNEAMFGEMKDAKQRHILDVAKKLDSDMKVVFVSKNAEVLSGRKGVYMRENNTMYLSKDNSVVESYFQLFKHECIHRLESRGAYSGLKNYLFRNSSSFERYARAQLKAKYKTEFKGTREEALKALAQLYIDDVQNGSFTEKFKNGFTLESAQREMVADFISEILFKGNRKDVAQHLADGNLEAIYDIEDTLSEFESLTETDRKWFEKIVDWIKDLIASLKGVNQNKRLVEDLEYIEKRLGRVFDSRDTKKAASKVGDEQFSLKIIHTDGSVEELFDARSLTEKEAVEYLYKAKKGELKGHSYIPIRKDTPQVIIDTLRSTGEKIENRSLVMQVRKAQQAMSQNNNGGKSKKYGSNVRKHALTPNEIVEIINNLDNPNTIILQTNRYDKDGKALPNNVAIFVEYSNNGNEGVAVVEFDSSIDSKFIGTEFGDMNYHTVVTTFEPDTERQGMPFDYVEELLKNPNNFELKIEKRQLTGSATQEKHPNTSSELPSIDSVPHKENTVNSNSMQETKNYSEVEENGEGSFSLGSPAQQMRDNLKKYESGETTNEEYLKETDKLWEQANEEYGSFPQGENAKLNMPVPMAVAEDKPTERFVRTIIETDTLTNEMLQEMEEKVLLGDFSYEVISNDTAIKKADSAVKNGTANEIWKDTVDSGKRITKNQIAVGERLLKDAIESGDTRKVLELSAELSDILTRAGQVVQSASLLKKMTGAGRLVSLQRTVKTINKDLRAKYGVDYPPIKISEESAKRLFEAKTAGGIEYAYQEIMQEVADQVPVTFLDKWNAWRCFAMLSNPKTHIRNIVGNGIFVPAVRIKNALATVMEKAVSEENRTKSLVIKKDYRDFAKNDVKRESVKNLLKGNKYNDKSTIREKQKVFKSKALNFLTDFNSNALEAEDMLFKNIHYINALAGFLQARKVDLKNVSQDTLYEARIYAVEEAKKATFNDESALANAIQRFGNKNLFTNILVEGVLPFKRTPINIIKRGIEYSPLGLIKTATKGLYDVKKGKISLSECIDGFASGLTGTGLLALGMVLASIGAISGGEDDDEKSRFEKLLGKQEYAVQIGNKSYTVDWAAPANIPFFIGVEIANISKNQEEFTFANVFNTMWNALEPITNLSMLSGIQGVIESARYAEPSQVISSIAIDALTSYGMQVVPSLSGAVSRTIDPTQRSWYTDKNDKWLDSTTQTIKNNIQSKVPGLSFTQIPKIDMWGQEVSRGGTAERVLENFISPGYYSEIEVNETSEELKRIFEKTDIDVFPNVASKSFELEGKTKHLTAQEYVTYAKAKGEYSYDYIKEFMEVSSYKKLTDEEKAEVIGNLYKYANAKAKTTVSNYDLSKQFKTVSQWERNGKSAVDYYIYKAISK